MRWKFIQWHFQCETRMFVHLVTLFTCFLETLDILDQETRESENEFAKMFSWSVVYYPLILRTQSKVANQRALRMLLTGLGNSKLYFQIQIWNFPIKCGRVAADHKHAAMCAHNWRITDGYSREQFCKSFFYYFQKKTRKSSKSKKCKFGFVHCSSENWGCPWFNFLLDFHVICWLHDVKYLFLTFFNRILTVFF